MVAAAKRHDPPRRSLSVLAWNEIENADAGKHYVWASETHKDSGILKYESLGYEAETYTKDGVRPGGKRKVLDEDVGRTIRHNGLVLMSCPIEWKRERELVGDNGESGSRLADEVEKRLVSQRMVRDELRGIRGGHWMTAVNETTEAVVEREKP